MPSIHRAHVTRIKTGSATMQPATADPWTDKLTAVADRRDRDAYAELFQHFAPLIKAYGLSTSNAQGLQQFAEELTQEVMIKVWQRAHLFDRSKASASTWIFSIARNTRIDLLRRQARHRGDLDADDIWIEAEYGEPVSEFQRKRVERIVHEGLRQLPMEQSQVIGKVYLEGKSHSEVADELDLPLGTVKSRVRLALQKLKVTIGA